MSTADVVAAPSPQPPGPAGPGPGSAGPSPAGPSPANKKHRRRNRQKSKRKNSDNQSESPENAAEADFAESEAREKSGRGRHSGRQRPKSGSESGFSLAHGSGGRAGGQGLRHSPAGSPARNHDGGRSSPHHQYQYSSSPRGRPSSPGQFSGSPRGQWQPFYPGQGQMQGHDPRGHDPRGHDPRGHDPRGQDPRGQDPRGQTPRGQNYRGYNGRGHPQQYGNHNPSANRQRQRQNSHGPKSKLFEKHWTLEEVSHGLKREELIQGALRINPKNYEDCYVPHPDGMSDVYICGSKDRNRALNSDIVAVKLYPREQWKVLADNLDTDISLRQGLERLSLSASSGQSATAGSSTPNMASPCKPPEVTSTTTTPVNTPGSAGQTGSQSTGQKSRGQATPRKRFTTLRDYASTPEIDRVTKKLFSEGTPGNQGEGVGEVQEERIKERMDAVPDKALVRTGKIVAIIEKKNSRAATGNLRLMTDKNTHTALFVPVDHRMPRLMIPMDQCPKDFHTRPDDSSQILFVARLTEWEEHSQFARGQLSRSLGEAGEIEPETEGMLISHDVDYAEFSDEAMACLPQSLPWSVPASEFSYRKDLRQECVFSIDPATARDLDDALHIKPLGDGLFEVGVHIADVSFFLEDETELDRTASSRSTSVYLVQKVIPMLPRLLCEQLCSLNPGEERLTFSVIWTMTEFGEIVDEWFGRSVIKSCIKMAYDHAQGFIEQPDRAWTEEELPAISGNFSASLLKEKVLQLHKIAQNLRKKRFDDGALRLDQVKLSFTLDKESGLPNGFYVYQQRDSNKLIEEFMLLANMAVAHKIYKAFPQVAVLRRHPPPQSKMMDDLVRTCQGLGVPIDISSSKKIHESIQAMAGETLEDRARVQILTVLCSKPMQNAKYFCTGTLEDEYEYRHYALSVPLYTHFTSPIRRYPDVMVHRLLAAALGYRDAPAIPKQTVQQQTNHSNDKKMNSKRVQELSSELFFAVFVKECGPLEERGMVMTVLDKAFDVLVLSLGVVKRVYCERLPLKNYGFQKKQNKPELRLVWQARDKHPEAVQELSIFSSVDCILTGDEKDPLKWTAIIKHPNDSSCR